MASEAPSWAEQWGSSAVQDNENDQPETKNKEKKKLANAKNVASASLDKAKAAATAGAHKVKNGASMGINWVKSQYQKRTSK